MRSIKKIKTIFGYKRHYPTSREEAQKTIREWWYSKKFKRDMNNPNLGYKLFQKKQWIKDNPYLHYMETKKPIYKMYEDAVKISRLNDIRRADYDNFDVSLNDIPMSSRYKLGYENDPFVIDSDIEYIKVNNKYIPMNIYKYKGKNKELRGNFVLYWGRHWNEIGIKYVNNISKKGKQRMQDELEEKLTDKRTGKIKEPQFNKRNIFYLENLGDLSKYIRNGKVTVEVKKKNNPFKYIFYYDENDIDNRTKISEQLKYSSREKGLRNHLFGNKDNYFDPNERLNFKF